MVISISSADGNKKINDSIFLNDMTASRHLFVDGGGQGSFLGLWSMRVTKPILVSW
jgi:hypothetical protein